MSTIRERLDTLGISPGDHDERVRAACDEIDRLRAEVDDYEEDFRRRQEYHPQCSAWDDGSSPCDCAEREARLREEVERMQRLPELEWARVTAVVAQFAARLSRSGDTGAGRKIIETLDLGKVYVDRLRAEVERLTKERDDAREAAELLDMQAISAAHRREVEALKAGRRRLAERVAGLTVSALVAAGADLRNVRADRRAIVTAALEGDDKPMSPPPRYDDVWAAGVAALEDEE